MRSLLLFASFLFATSSVCGYNITCDEGNNYSFFVEELTQCKDFFICYNGRMMRLSCPDGYAFDDSESRCVPASLFTCVEESKENQLIPTRSKRSIISFHSIHKGKAKEAVWHFMESLKKDAMNALMEAAPSVHDSIKNKYIPFLKLIKNATMPVFEQYVLPRLEKACTYGKTLGVRVFKKVQQSWEISNSTHINLVSFSDIASDLSNDLKPVMQLGKYFSSRLTTRHKRSIMPSRPLFETVFGFLQPVASSVFKIATTLAAGNDPFLRDYVLPMVFNMMDHPQTAAEIKEIVWIAKRIYTPIVSEFFSGRRYNRGYDGVVFQVSNPVLEDAKFRLYTEVKPIVSNIFERHLQMILYRSGVYLPLITETLERMSAYSGDEVKDLKHDLLLFFAKHSEFFATNDKSFRNVKTFTEMKKDLEPIKKKLLKVAMDYLSHSPNAMLNVLFSRNSFLYRLL